MSHVYPTFAHVSVTAADMPLAYPSPVHVSVTLADMPLADTGTHERPSALTPLHIACTNPNPFPLPWAQRCEKKQLKQTVLELSSRNKHLESTLASAKKVGGPVLAGVLAVGYKPHAHDRVAVRSDRYCR
jgi:hypothetical protein